jgi:hypothetical protein
MGGTERPGFVHLPCKPPSIFCEAARVVLGRLQRIPPRPKYLRCSRVVHRRSPNLLA